MINENKMQGLAPTRRTHRENSRGRSERGERGEGEVRHTQRHRHIWQDYKNARRTNNARPEPEPAATKWLSPRTLQLPLSLSLSLPLFLSPYPVAFVCCMLQFSEATKFTFVLLLSAPSFCIWTLQRAKHLVASARACPSHTVWRVDYLPELSYVSYTHMAKIYRAGNVVLSARYPKYMTSLCHMPVIFAKIGSCIHFLCGMCWYGKEYDVICRVICVWRA